MSGIEFLIMSVVMAVAAGALALAACQTLFRFFKGLAAFVSLPDGYNKFRAEESYYYFQWKAARDAKRRRERRAQRVEEWKDMLFGFNP